jgi:uncharacterized OB-fold protein
VTVNARARVAQGAEGFLVHVCPNCGHVEGERPQPGCCPNCGRASEPILGWGVVNHVVGVDENERLNADGAAA